MAEAIAFIPLRARTGAVRAWAKVDLTDSDRLLQWRWSLDSHGYAVRVYRVGSKQRNMKMHRQILGAQKGEECDHVDGDRLNNVRANLRLVCHADNQKNAKRRIDNTSGHKGVRRTESGRWRAEIKSDGKRYWLGRFDTAEDAAAAYEQAARRLHGEFFREESDADKRADALPKGHS